MISQEEILEKVLDKVSDRVATAVMAPDLDAVRNELSSAIAETMVESEFYKHLNQEMRDGLKGIYQEISSVSKPGEQPLDSGQTQELFHDATKQIEEIMQTTLEATESIMASAEKLLEQQEEAGRLIASIEVQGKDSERLARLDEINAAFTSSLTDIITSLSFQDLTGQRLKKVVAAITTIRETVFDLYISTGLMLKQHEETPDKDIVRMKEDSKRMVEEIKGSELKGPSSDAASQQDVDDLLASLGL